MGHNTRYGTALCALSASPLPVYGTNIHSGWLNYFGVLSSLIHARVFPLRSYRCTYRFVPNRVRENTNNEAIEATSSLGCSCFPYSPLLYFYFYFFFCLQMFTIYSHAMRILYQTQWTCSRKTFVLASLERGHTATNKAVAQNWGEEVQLKALQPSWWPPWLSLGRLNN